MNLEQQLTNLELSKRLHELGIDKESLFYYLNIDGDGKYYIYFNEHLPEDFEYEGEPIPALTSSELLEILPACIDTKQNEPFNYFWLQICKRSAKNIQYCTGYFCDTVEAINFPSMGSPILKSHDEKFPDALAKILINLIESGHVRAGDL